MHRRAAGLEDHDVRPLLRDQQAAGHGVDSQRDLIRHRRGRQEQRGLLSEQLGRTALQLVDCRVLAQLLVAELGGRHRLEHLGRGSRGGVGAEVDHLCAVR